MSTKVTKRRKQNKTKRIVQKVPFELSKLSVPRNIQWMHDFDYLHKLSPRESLWMAKFIKEYLNGNVKKGDRKALHKSKALRQDCYRRKNNQNRDMMSILNSRGKMDRIDDPLAENVDPILRPAFDKNKK